jgi:hypothetical protein
MSGLFKTADMLNPTLEILRNGFVPKSDFCLVVVDDGTQLCITVKIGHELAHAVNALGEINDTLFRRLRVECDDGIVNRLAQNGG